MQHKLDPYAQRLIGPAKRFELEQVSLGGVSYEVFKSAPRTLNELYARAASFGDRLMAAHNDVRLSYGEVFARAAALSRALRDRYGVRRGAKIAIVTGNCIEWLIAVIAVNGVGAVAALINSRGAAEEMLRAIATVDCELVIVDAERARVLATAPRPPAWPRILIGAEATVLGDAEFADLATPAADEVFAPIEVDPRDGALIMFTSGTTGFPKGALLSHLAVAHAMTLAGVMGAVMDLQYETETGRPVPPDRQSMTSPVVVVSPMFHLSGMTPTLRALSVGASIHIIDKWNAEVAFDAVERLGLTRLGFVPTMLWDMLRSPNLGKLRSVRYLANGGAALMPSLVAELEARLPDVFLTNSYGQTENAGWACSISGRPYLERPLSCGWRFPTVEVEVRRDDGSPADVGERGEVWVRSACVMNEYVNDPAATAQTVQDGWCASGDIGLVDEGGVFTIVDRKKNMVISGGENIYCAEVERVLFEHPDIVEAIAYGRPDPRLGERLAVTVVLEPGAQLSADDVKAYCRSRLAIYKTPRDVVTTASPLPRTASGKVDRGVFLSQLAGA